MRILIAEDEIAIASALVSCLVDSGLIVDHVDNGAAADRALRTTSYDLLVVDLTLPRMDGLQVLAGLRSRQAGIPVLVVTARESVDQRVAALDLGADDYLVKPFSLKEFAARVRALLRRSNNDGMPDLSIGALRINLVARRAWAREHALELTAREYALLEALSIRRNRVVSRQQLTEALCDWERDLTDNGLDILIHRLRRKLPAAGVHIRTLRGLGYLLESGDGTA